MALMASRQNASTLPLHPVWPDVSGDHVLDGGTQVNHRGLAQLSQLLCGGVLGYVDHPASTVIGYWISSSGTMMVTSGLMGSKAAEGISTVTLMATWSPVSVLGRF